MKYCYMSFGMMKKKISVTTANANEDVKQPELSLLQYWWEYKMMRPLGELFKFFI